ncbi:hypothetical protein HU200_048942 [Digitaria exilis]|uniref:DUF4220 domain-containing protein n=1 Tax=Digitaria exilis TaxID=1010633 RepID=A0A835AX77_9POAL|nr:hypothetical protein HU200_048942 [Digitaria exilis]
MADIQSLITNLIINWNQDAYILFRIWFLVGLLFVMYLILCSPKSDRASILNLIDVLSDSILAYVLGAMQATTSKNQAFPVLALALVGYRYTFNTLSRYGTYAELRNMLRLLAVAYTNVTHGSSRTPFWIFWISLALKSLNRILARYQVSESLCHGQSSEFLQEYMDAVTPHRCDPETMEGYTYLVYGEAKRNNKTGQSLYNLSSLVTLDKVWRYDRPILLRCINKQRNNMKDLCLAVALSRLLKCRVEGATLHAGSVSTTRKLVYAQILTDAAEECVPADNADMVLVNNAEKAFGTLGMDLFFLNDYLHTSFPMVFGEGPFLSLTFNLLQPIVRYVGSDNVHPIRLDNATVYMQVCEWQENI